MTLPLGRMRHTITLERPVSVSDNEGGFTETFAALTPPTAKAAIDSASQRTLERLVSGTILSEASHIIQMRYHRDVDLKTRLTWTDRAGKVHVANVLNVTDPDGLAAELLIVAAEVVT
jgi:Bacteriophage head-tail adaptor